MNKKIIIITGGLGYIGTELCKLYCGETRIHDIYVIDNRFISERVKQLFDWGFKFLQIDIRNLEQINNIIQNADVVHHLAGITDVAYTKTESNDEKDILISETAIQGTNNILKSLNKKTKIIFPSTHVVFEGFDDTKFNITEEESPTPILTYAKSKVQNERDIKNSGINYIILRLGSVYGYSNDSMRINIMPNLFSKMSSQNQKIKLFSEGKQHKSLVSVIDVARCFKFMAESKISNEIFHLSNENKTVRQVAELCKKYNNKVELVSTNDEIPNLGYTLSNKKLLNTGFQFYDNLENAIKVMISNWSHNIINENLEYTIKGADKYVDERGVIANYELTEPINLVGYIESKAGTVRANHYHPIQEQKCLLVKGKYISIIKDLYGEDSKIQTQIIKAGDLSIIKPNVIHTMVFLEDSIFLNLVRGERQHDNYGITHTIPYKLIDSDFKNNLLLNYSHKCRACNGENLMPVISLGLSPLANNLIENINDNSEFYPLEMFYCDDCSNCQLSYIVPPDKMFKKYFYVSSTTKSFREHFISASEKYIDIFKLNESSCVVDIGSNDGIALKPLKEKGIKVVGVEPATNISELANKNGIFTINDYFTIDVANKILVDYGSIDLVTASNVFAHSDKVGEITSSVFKILKEDGCFIIEVQYLLDTLKKLTFDNIYHEHVNYWSVTSLNHFFNRYGGYVSDVERINTHGGSIRVYVKKHNNDIKPSVDLFLNEEINEKLNDYQTYLLFAKNINELKNNVIKNINKLKKDGFKIVGYGAPAKATTALNYFGINNKLIDFIVEDNQLKHNKIIPGVNITISPKEKLIEKGINVVIVMAWNFFEEIKLNNKDLIDNGINFISIKDLEKNEL